MYVEEEYGIIIRIRDCMQNIYVYWLWFVIRTIFPSLSNKSINIKCWFFYCKNMESDFYVSGIVLSWMIQCEHYCDVT